MICGGEERRLDNSVAWELPDSAASVRVLWELPGSVQCVPDPDALSTGTALRLRPYILPTRGAGWLSELPSGSLVMVQYWTMDEGLFGEDRN